MKYQLVSHLDSDSYKGQSSPCSVPLTNSATYPKEGPRSKKPYPERPNVKVVVDTCLLCRVSDYATGAQSLKANIPYCIKVQGSETIHLESPHSKISVYLMVLLAERANLVFLRGATPLECYGTRQMSFLDWITAAPLLGAESCQQTALL